MPRAGKRVRCTGEKYEDGPGACTVVAENVGVGGECTAAGDTECAAQLVCVYVEGKERFEKEMEIKYISIVDSNPRMMLLIITPNILSVVMSRLNAHPRIEVVLSVDEIPVHWMERTGNG